MQVTLILSGLVSAEGRMKVAEIGAAPFVIGRSPGADWTLIDETNRISGEHLSLRVRDGALLVTDSSSGGTALGSPGARLRRDQPAPLPERATLFLPVGEIAVEWAREGAQAGQPEDGAERDDVFGIRDRAQRGEPTPPAGFGAASGGPRLGQGRAGTSAPQLMRAPSPSAAPAPSGGGLSFDDELKAARGGSGGGPFSAAAPPEFGAAPTQPDFGVAPKTPAFEAPAPVSGPAGGVAPPSQPAPAQDERDQRAAAPGLMRGAQPGETKPGETQPVEAKPVATQPPEPQPPEPAPAETTQPAPAAQPAPQSGAAGSAADSAALDAMFRALGLDPDAMTPERRAATAETVGATYAAMADALRQLLMARDNVKRELGIARTAVQFGSNPLKFTWTREAAVEALLAPMSEGYLAGEAAIDDALSSMQAHQLALVGAIRAAVRTALDAFDPEALEQRIEKGGLSQVVPALRRAELWERFREDYARFADQADQDIRMVIGRELDRLYANENAGAPAPSAGARPGWSGPEGGQAR